MDNNLINENNVQNKTIIDEIMQMQLIKWIYKLHKNDDFVKLPIIKTLAIETYRKLAKNKFYYTNFLKDFLIDPNLVYLSSSIEKKIEEYIKDNKTGFLLDLIVLLFVIDLSKTKDVELQKTLKHIWNINIEVVYKKVKWNIEKFITKDTIFIDKIVWFKLNSSKQNRLFFSTWSARDIRAIKTEQKEITTILNVEKILFYLKRFKGETNIYNNIIIYILLTETLDTFNKIKTKYSSDDKIYKQYETFVNIMINTFVWTIYINKDFFEKLWFGLRTWLDINKMNSVDIEALKNFIKNYYTFILKDIMKVDNS